MPPAIDLTGQRFGRLTAIRRVENRSWGERVRQTRVMWEVVCDCGQSAIVHTGALRSGHTRSCGCLYREERTKGNFKHGMKRTKEYRAYQSAKGRCRNPNSAHYDRYGGRGIEFRFSSFEEWLSELGPAPGPEWSVDRRDVNGHYEPGNVRWATDKTQAANKACPCPNCPELKGHAPAGQEREAA